MNIIETNFAFPLLRLKNEVNFTQVKKPSGISYFLLVLINESTDRKQKISDLLKQFGVPSDLYDLFANEMIELINLGIIRCLSPYDKTLFQEYQLQHFSFTDKGKKVFLEESIPLEGNKTIKLDVFYNPAFKEMFVTSDQPYGNVEKTVLDASFFDKIPLPTNDSIEEYLNKKKSNGIPIKKEEMILESNLFTTEKLFVTNPITIKVSENDAVTFEFEDAKLHSFFHENYTGSMITNGLALKNKFQFPVGGSYKTKLSKLHPYEKVYVPEELKQQLAQKALIDLRKDDYMTKNSKLSYLLPKMVNELNEAGAFIKIFDLARASLFIPALISTQNEVFGPIDINLLVERKLDSGEIEKLVNQLLAKHHIFNPSDDDEFGFKRFVQLCKISNKLDLVNTSIDKWLKELEVEEKIELLSKIKEKSNNEPIVYEHIKALGLQLLPSYFNGINSANLEYRLYLTSWIIKSNKLSNSKVLECLFNHDDFSDEELIAIFDILSNNNYSPREILPFNIRLTQLLFSTELSGSKFATEVKTLRNTLDSLVALSGIKNPTDYETKEVLDRVKFMNYFSTFKTTFKSLSFIESIDKNSFNRYQQYLSVFDNLNNLYVSEKNAQNNPSSITEVLIESKINSGDILAVVIYLYVKLNYIFKTKFKLEKDFSDMINELKKLNHIGENTAKLLHDFRIFRNDIEHVNQEKRKDLSLKDLSQIKDIIFGLEKIEL